MTDMHGGPFCSDDREILASNGRLHGNLLEVIGAHEVVPGPSPELRSHAHCQGGPIGYHGALTHAARRCLHAATRSYPRRRLRQEGTNEARNRHCPGRKTRPR